MMRKSSGVGGPRRKPPAASWREYVAGQMHRCGGRLNNWAHRKGSAPGVTGSKPRPERKAQTFEGRAAPVAASTAAEEAPTRVHHFFAPTRKPSADGRALGLPRAPGCEIHTVAGPHSDRNSVWPEVGISSLRV